MSRKPERSERINTSGGPSGGRPNSRGGAGNGEPGGNDRAFRFPMKPNTAGTKRPASDSRGNSPSTKQAKLTERGPTSHVPRQPPPTNAPTGPRASRDIWSPLDAVRSPAERSHGGSGASTPITEAPPAPNMVPLSVVSKPPPVQRSATAPILRTGTSNAAVTSTVGAPRLQRRSSSNPTGGGGNLHSLRNIRAGKQNAVLSSRLNAESNALATATQISANISPQQLAAEMQKMRGEWRDELLREVLQLAGSQKSVIVLDKGDKVDLRDVIEEAKASAQESRQKFEADMNRKLKDELEQMKTQFQLKESRAARLTDDYRDLIARCVRETMRKDIDLVEDKFDRKFDDVDRDYGEVKKRCRETNQRCEDLSKVVGDHNKTIQRSMSDFAKEARERLARIDGEERGTVKGLGDRLEVVEQHVVTLQTDVKGITDNRLAAMEGSMKELQVEVKGVHTNVQQQSEAFDDNLKKVDQRVDEGVAGLEGKLCQLNDAVVSNEKVYDEKYATRQYVDDMVSSIQTQGDARQLQTFSIDTAGSRGGHAENPPSDLAARVSKLEDDYKKLDTHVDDSAKEFDKFTEFVNEEHAVMNENMKTLRAKNLLSIQEKMDKVWPEVEDIKKTIAELRKTQNQHATSQTPDRSPARQALSDRVQALQTEFTRLQQRLENPEELQQLISDATDAIVRPRMQQVYKDTNIAAGTACEVAKRYAMEQKIELHQHFENDKADLYNYAQGNARAIQQLQVRYENISSEALVSRMVHYMQQTYPTAPNLIANVRKHERDLTTLSADMARLRTECAALQLAMSQVEQSEDTNANGNRPNRDRDGVNGLAAQTRQSQSVNSNSPNGVPAPQPRLTATELRQLQEKVSALETTLNEHAELFKEASKSETFFRDNIKTLLKAVTDITEESKRIGETVAKIEEEHNAYKGESSDRLKKLAEKLDTELAERNGKNVASREAIGGFRDNVNKICTGLRADIKQLNSDIGGLQGKMDTLAKGKDASTAQVAELLKYGKEFRDIAGRFPHLEYSIAQLQVYVRQINDNASRPLQDMEFAAWSKGGGSEDGEVVIDDANANGNGGGGEIEGRRRRPC